MTKLYNQYQEHLGIKYNVGDLVEKSKEYEVENVDIRLLQKWYDLGLSSEETTLYSVADVYKRVMEADLKYPLIISNTGSVLDGKHRLCKAIIENKKTIKVIVIPVDDMPPAMN